MAHVIDLFLMMIFQDDIAICFYDIHCEWGWASGTIITTTCSAM